MFHAHTCSTTGCDMTCKIKLMVKAKVMWCNLGYILMQSFYRESRGWLWANVILSSTPKPAEQLCVTCKYSAHGQGPGHVDEPLMCFHTTILHPEWPLAVNVTRTSTPKPAEQQCVTWQDSAHGQGQGHVVKPLIYFLPFIFMLRMAYVNQCHPMFHTQTSRNDWHGKIQLRSNHWYRFHATIFILRMASVSQCHPLFHAHACITTVCDMTGFGSWSRSRSCGWTIDMLPYNHF
jgi:hypothetical protein